MANATGNYTVVVDGQKFNVSIAEGDADIQVTPASNNSSDASSASVSTSGEATDVPATVNGNVWKILVNEGEKVEKDQKIMILEAMKMEIDINAPVAGTISKITVGANEAVDEGQTLAIIG